MKNKQKSRSAGKSKKQVIQSGNFVQKQPFVPEGSRRLLSKDEGRYQQSYLADKTCSNSRTRHSELETVEATRRDEKQQEEKPNQKKSIGQDKPSRIQLYRNLLPDYLNFKLPANLAHLWEIVSKIDKHLLQLPQKMQRQSFHNIQSFMESAQGIQLTQAHLQQINYILPAYYNFYQDPLHNLILGIPKGQSVPIRQHNFRKMMHKLYKQNLQSTDRTEDLPAQQLLIKRTSCFYPVKKIQVAKKSLNQAKRPKKQFIQVLHFSISQKQNQQNHWAQVGEAPSIDERNKQEECMRKIYMERNVSSIYKTTLIQILVEKLGTGYGTIIKGLQTIISYHSQFDAVEVGGTTIVKYVGKAEMPSI